jgi:hypothetical protein
MESTGILPFEISLYQDCSSSARRQIFHLKPRLADNRGKTHGCWTHANTILLWRMSQELCDAALRRSSSKQESLALVFRVLYSESNTAEHSESFVIQPLRKRQARRGFLYEITLQSLIYPKNPLCFTTFCYTSDIVTFEAIFPCKGMYVRPTAPTSLDPPPPLLKSLMIQSVEDGSEITNHKPQIPKPNPFPKAWA